MCLASKRCLWAIVLLLSPAWANASLKYGNLQLSPNAGWKIEQTTKARSTEVVVLKKGERTAFLFSRQGSYGANPLRWESDSRVIDSGTFMSATGLSWEWMTSVYVNSRSNQERNVSTIFYREDRGTAYYGYVTAQKESDVEEALREVLNAIASDRIFGTRSLTPTVGNKYYLGFGDNLSGFMGNEVKYDIAHTHDIFTSEIGGSYIGTKIVGSGQGKTQIRQKWKELQEKMTWSDMYVQYSAGHGYTKGLAIGLTYNEIRDAVLAFPAQEVIIFLMACHSGGIVDSFNANPSAWENWKKWDRTLFVMGSSRTSETSSTGPGKDGEEPNGPNGSAGSAFGHALWKALIGHADGYNQGIKDGFISLGEIIDYSVWKTKRVGGHTPVYTGTFSRDLVMNRVPSENELARFEGTTEGLSEAQVAQRIQELNRLISGR